MCFYQYSMCWGQDVETKHTGSLCSCGLLSGGKEKVNKIISESYKGNEGKKPSDVIKRK